MKKIVVVLVFLLNGVIVFSQTYHNSAATGLWSAPATWDGNGVPNLNGNTLDITINSPHVVTSDVALDFKKSTIIRVKNGAKLVIGSTLSVDILDAAKNFTIIVETGGILEITGNFFAAKDATLNISGAATFTGNVTLGNTAILNIEGPVSIIGNLSVGTTSQLNVDMSAPAGGTLSITGNLTGGAGTVINGTGRVSVGGTVTGVTDPGTGQLPIELVKFTAIPIKMGVKIYWETATELNNDYFTLERSADGVNYEIIGTVLGAGTSMKAINYSFTDNYPLNGVSYYRLTQTDYDGKFEVFSPVSVSYLNESEIKIGSNPAAKELNISMSGEMGLGTAKIYNIIGVLVKTVEITDNYTTINVSDMTKGAYILVVSANKTQITKKVMIQ